MIKQSQWLFEAPFVLESDRYSIPEYYGDFDTPLPKTLCPEENILVVRKLKIACKQDFDAFMCGVWKILDVYHTSKKKRR